MKRAQRCSRLARRGGLLACTTLLLVTPGGRSDACAQGFEREAAFLTVPMGARVVGLGRAAVSIRGELQSVRWNPAVLGSISSLEPLASHYDGPLDFRFNYLTVSVPAGKVGVFAFGVDVQNFGEIQLSSAPETPLGVIEPSNLVVSLTYARELVPRLDLGVTGKWVRSELSGELSGSTFAFDFGLLWRPLERVPLDLGVSALNAGPGLRLDEAGEVSPLPGRLRLGANYDLLRHLDPGGAVSLRVALDLEHALRDLGTGSQFAGAELGIAGLLFLRGGYIAETLIETNTGGTVGVGFVLGPLHFDLARELGVNQLGDETHLSLAARL